MNNTLPQFSQLANSDLPDDEISLALWCFTAQYAMLKQMAATLPVISRIEATGQAQIAACVIAGALPLAQAISWLVNGNKSADLTPDDYVIACKFSAGHSLALNLHYNNSLPELKNAIIVSLNLDGLCPKNEQVLYCITQHNSDFGYLFGRLAMISQLDWKTLGYANFTKLPSYPWQRQSFWLPKSTENDQQPVDEPRQQTSNQAELLVTESADQRAALSTLSAAEQHQTLLTYLQEKIAASLQMSATQINTEQPLNTLGMDSLTAVEIKNRIERDLKVKVSIVKFLDGYSIADFVNLIASELAAPTHDAPLQALKRHILLHQASN